MSSEFLLAALSLGTLGAVAVLAFISRRKTIERMKDDNAKKSRLADDAPNK